MPSTGAMTGPPGSATGIVANPGRPALPAAPWYRRRPWQVGLALGLVALAVATVLIYRLWGGDTWEVTVFEGEESVTLCLLKIDTKDGKARAEVVSSHPAFKKGFVVKDFTADDHSVRFTLKSKSSTFRVVAYVPEGEKRPKKLLGSVQAGGRYAPLWMELTDKRELTEKNASRRTTGFRDLAKLDDADTAKEQEDGFRAILKKYSGEPVTYLAAQSLFGLKVANNAPPAEVRPAADEFIRLASAYGREMKLQATWHVARAIVRGGKELRLALGYARRAERELADGDSVVTKVAVLKVLVKALRQAGKGTPGQLKDLDARLAKLEGQLDDEFAKQAVPFKVEPYAGRKAKSDRAVLVELFTGAYCPPCVGADIAFDATLKAYKPSEVVLLQYHLHIPAPDPLTNAEGVSRSESYDVSGTPSLYIDGKKVRNVIGGRDDGQDSYDAMRKVIDDDLETPADAQLKLDVKRTGDRLDIEAAVSGLKKTGKEVRLRFVLIEDVVRFPGGNGQRLHHHVVRALPGGVKGFALTAKSDKQTVRVGIDDVRKVLSDYLNAENKERPFAADDRPLDLKHLKVVAFIQDDKSKDVLQAAQADVPAK